MTLYVLAYLVIAVVVGNLLLVCSGSDDPEWDDVTAAMILGIGWPITLSLSVIASIGYVITLPARMYLRRKR